MKRAAVLVVAASLAFAKNASAEEARSFGERGQLLLTADRLLPLVSFTTQTVTANDGAVTTETTDRGGSFAFFVGREPGLSPIHTVPRLTADVTIFRHVTVGTAFVAAFGLASAHIERTTPAGQPQTTRENDAPSATLFGFAPRIGYILPLGAHVALWGRGGVAFYSVQSSSATTTNAGATTTSTEKDTVFSLDLDPQLVWLPVPHLLLHVGPLVNFPLSGSHETAFAQGSVSQSRSDNLSVFHVGLSAALGGWFDL